MKTSVVGIEGRARIGGDYVNQSSRFPPLIVWDLLHCSDRGCWRLLIAEAAVLCCHHDKRSSGSTRFLITVTKNINFLTRSFFFNGIDFSTKCFAQKMTKSQPWKHSFLALKIQFFFSLLTVYFVRTLVCKYGMRGELNNFRR